jgi:hypothetical protein
MESIATQADTRRFTRVDPFNKSGRRERKEMTLEYILYARLNSAVLQTSGTARLEEITESSTSLLLSALINDATESYAACRRELGMLVNVMLKT